VGGSYEYGKNPRAPLKAGKFLTICTTISFSKRTVLRGIMVLGTYLISHRHRSIIHLINDAFQLQRLLVKIFVYKNFQIECSLL
jgi:hypothetical protein